MWLFCFSKYSYFLHKETGIIRIACRKFIWVQSTCSYKCQMHTAGGDGHRLPISFVVSSHVMVTRVKALSWIVFHSLYQSGPWITCLSIWLSEAFNFHHLKMSEGVLENITVPNVLITWGGRPNFMLPNLLVVWHSIGHRNSCRRNFTLWSHRCIKQLHFFSVEGLGSHRL